MYGQFSNHLNLILTKYLYLCGTCHVCIYYLYNMTLWGSMSVMLTMSWSYYRGVFQLESLVYKICIYIEVGLLSSVILKSLDCTWLEHYWFCKQLLVENKATYMTRIGITKSSLQVFMVYPKTCIIFPSLKISKG